MAVVAAGSAALALLACGARSAQPAAMAPITDSRAADLRVRLDSLLGEHVLLSAKATDAAIDGRSDEYAAYARLLTRSSADLGDLLGSALGHDAQSRFDQLWSTDYAAVVQYTASGAAHDRTAQAAAMRALTAAFVPQFADFFSSAIGLPRDTLFNLATEHVQATEQIVDDQSRKTWTSVYADVRDAYADMQRLGDTLASAIVRKARSKLPGSATGRAVDLRVALDQLLQEHAYLATGAADAALGGRPEQFTAAQKALGDNGADLGRALGAVDGAAAQSRFDGIWAAHDASFADYTLAVARDDRAAEARAAADLTDNDVPQLANFLAGATGLPRTSLANLLVEHVLTTRDVVDAQGQRDLESAARKDRIAAQHMAMIGDQVAAAIVARTPQKFR